MPKILILIRYGITARTLLRTSFLDSLLAANIKVIVACPAFDEPKFLAEMTAKGVQLIPEPKLKKRLFERIYNAIANALCFEHPGTTKTLTMKWLHEGLIKPENPYKLRIFDFLFRGLMGVLNLHRSRKLRQLLLKLDPLFCKHPEIENLFDEVKPDLFFSPYPFEPDAHYIAEAKKRGIPAIGAVKSWDNLTSKIRVACEPDHWIAWSPQMKKEAVQYHYVDPEKIEITGTPQFDFYFKAQKFLPRDSFFKKMNIDPQKKLIVYSPGTSWTYSDEANLRMIHSIIMNTDFPYKCHLHIRKYPKSSVEYSSITNELGITVEDSGSVVPQWTDRIDQSPKDLEHLRQLMHFSDIVIQVSSSIAVDAACEDTPCIAYHLDKYDKVVPWAHRAKRCYSSEHNQLLIKAGGMRVVETKNELKYWLLQYLEYPETDSEGRKSIVSNILWNTDGQAGNRLAKALMNWLP